MDMDTTGGPILKSDLDTNTGVTDMGIRHTITADTVTDPILDLDITVNRVLIKSVSFVLPPIAHGKQTAKRVGKNFVKFKKFIPTNPSIFFR